MRVRKELVIAVVLGVLFCSILVSAVKLPDAQATNPQVNIGYNVWALATDGTYIYAASSSASGGYDGVLYALTASLSTAGSVVLDTWATSGNNYDIGETPTQMLYYNGYLYLIDEDCVAQVQYASGSFTQVANLGRSQLLMSSAYNYGVADAQEYNGYLYVVGDSNAEAFGQYYVTLWAIHLSNLAVTDEVTTIACSSSGQLISIVNGNLWVTFPSAGYMYEFSTSLSQTGSFAFSETNAVSVVTDGTYIYSVSSSSSDYLWTFDAASGQAQNSINEGVICQAMYPQSMTYLSGYVFLASYSANDLIAFSTPGMQLLISESVSATGLDSVMLNSAGTEMYVGSDDGYVTEIPVSSIPTPAPTGTPTPTPTPSITPAPTMTPTLPVVPTNGWTVANGASSVNAVSTSNWEYGSEPFMLVFPEGPDANTQNLNVPVAAFTGFSFQAEDGSSDTYAWVTYTFSDHSTASSSEVLVDSGSYQTFNLGFSGLTGKWPCYTNLNITAITMNYNSQSQSPIYINDVTLSYATPTSSESFSLGYGGYQVGYIAVNAPAVDVADLSLQASGSGIGNVYVTVLFNDGSYAISSPQIFNNIATLFFPMTTDESATITTVQIYANDSTSQVTINDVSFDYPGTGGFLPTSPTPTAASTPPTGGRLPSLPTIWKTLTSIWRKIPTLLQDLMTAFLVLMILLLFASAASRRDKNKKRTSRPRIRVTEKIGTFVSSNFVKDNLSSF